MTACLLCELVKRKIKVIFCDEARNPHSELMPYYGSHDTSDKICCQIAWSDTVKQTVWTEIVTQKIKMQAEFLKELGKEEYLLLQNYVSQVEYNDATNREGHAAKVYFNALFGKDFSRGDDNFVNAALNYGYAVLLSAFNREIVSNGYITQLGLFHDNTFNPFNFSCDLMEPYRPLVDRIVFAMQPQKFETEEKMLLADILNKEVLIDGKKHYVNNAVKIYCKSVFYALEENDASKIKFYQNIASL